MKKKNQRNEEMTVWKLMKSWVVMFSLVEFVVVFIYICG